MIYCAVYQCFNTLGLYRSCIVHYDSATQPCNYPANNISKTLSITHIQNHMFLLLHVASEAFGSDKEVSYWSGIFKKSYFDTSLTLFINERPPTLSAEPSKCFDQRPSTSYLDNGAEMHPSFIYLW